LSDLLFNNFVSFYNILLALNSIMYLTIKILNSALL